MAQMRKAPTTFRAERPNAAAKALRFGLSSHHPATPWENNLEQISRELGDVRTAYDRLIAAKSRKRAAHPTEEERG